MTNTAAWRRLALRLAPIGRAEQNGRNHGTASGIESAPNKAVKRTIHQHAAFRIAGTSRRQS
jgi:hypothetical protein